MFTIDEISALLDEAAYEIPQELYGELNGGVNLLPETKYHAADTSGGLCVLGEYRHDGMGRYIVIYYGSLCESYPRMGRGAMKERLKKLLLHELTHHIESLAGEHGLEDKDRRDIERYKRGGELN
ncbi:MAG: metallopeptidase family protein [Oscillospiraceae bacterium]|nr:metallopeptidase family protein [Oscillospiraceae bacterium]